MDKSILHQGYLIEEDYLETEYRLRNSDFLFDEIKNDTPIPEGWSLFREYKTKTKIKKKKKTSELLEDKVWRLFYDLGANKLSSKKFSLILKDRGKTKKTKQIDVLAIDNDVVFVIECKTRDVLGKKILKKEIAEFAGNSADIRDSVKKLVQNRELTFVFILATENIIPDDNDLNDAKEASIYVWDEYDIDRLQELTKLTGQGAKYQLYNILFAGKKLKNFDIKVPALKSKMGGKTYYSFVLPPEELLKISYVHHRSRHSNFLDLADSYQRMINPQRIRKIEQFIEDGGFFPGNIIINFHQRLLKEELLGDKKHLGQAIDCSKPVIITLPNSYGSAWIIDGQHRLYAYSDLAEKRKKETVPVIAFVEEDRGNEAKIFVDINKNQKSIEANLLWDLYEDLYSGSEVDKEKELYVISKIAKELCSRKESPFLDHIEIPKEQNKGNLTLYSICNGIYQHRLLSNREDERILFYGSYEESIDYATDRIIWFFDELKKMMPDEWNMGDEHYIRTNAGFVVLIGILKDLFECTLSKAEQIDPSKYRNSVRKFIEPIVYYFIDCEKEKIANYRGAGGAGQKSRQVRYELTKEIYKANLGFRSTWLEKYESSFVNESKFEKKKEGMAYYLDMDECDKLEFKGSLSLDLRRFLLGDGKLNKDPKLIDEGVLKTIVSFLNSSGGDIIIGIIEQHRFKNASDDKLDGCPLYKDKIIFGIESEYGNDKWDGYLQKLLNYIENRIGPFVLDNELITIKKMPHSKKDLCLISIKPSETKQYLYNSKFYVRRANKTEQLEGKDIDNFWAARNKKNCI